MNNYRKNITYQKIFWRIYIKTTNIYQEFDDMDQEITSKSIVFK